MNLIKKIANFSSTNLITEAVDVTDVTDIMRAFDVTDVKDIMRVVDVIWMKTLKGFDIQKIVHIQHQIANQSSDVHVKTIDPNELTESHVHTKRTILIKKFYGTIEVECKDL
ncbi:7368_t:CDS:2, partial [Gigaspora rosea]